MPQDQKTKQAYEHADKREKVARAEVQAEDTLDAALLRGDQHTGQQGVMPSAEDSYEAADNKQIYALLPDFHKDELRRIQIVPRGQRLKPGGVYLDLRNLAAGELTAHGEETVGDELLVAKRDEDFEIWNKLLGRQRVGQ